MRRFVVWMYAPNNPQWSMPPTSVARIREALGSEWEVESVEVTLNATGDGVQMTPPELVEAIANAEIYCGWGIRQDAFMAAKKLRWFHSGAAGVSTSLFDEMRESDVIFTNSADMYSEPLAEHALAAILHFTRGIDVAVQAQARGHWAQEDLTNPQSPLMIGRPAGEIAGATLGIIGYGGIGSALGRRAHALGMEVQAIRRTPGPLPPELTRIEGPDYLPQLLESSDFIVIAAPDTRETYQLIGANELALIRPTSVLISLTRGSLIDDEALIQALSERRLRGAALDVFQKEPLPSDHPFWTLDNILITPHVGGTSVRFWDRQTELILSNIRRYISGEELRNRVDKEHGY